MWYIHVKKLAFSLHVMLLDVPFVRIFNLNLGAYRDAMLYHLITAFAIQFIPLSKKEAHEIHYTITWGRYDNMRLKRRILK